AQRADVFRTKVRKHHAPHLSDMSWGLFNDVVPARIGEHDERRSTILRARLSAEPAMLLETGDDMRETGEGRIGGEGKDGHKACLAWRLGQHGENVVVKERKARVSL